MVDIGKTVDIDLVYIKSKKIDIDKRVDIGKKVNIGLFTRKSKR